MDEYIYGFKIISNDKLEDFHIFTELPEERELWSGNYNNATRDEYVAARAWFYQQAKLDKSDDRLTILSAVLANLRYGKFKDVDAVNDYIDYAIDITKDDTDEQGTREEPPTTGL